MYYIKFGDDFIVNQEENTLQMQIDSVINVATAIHYAPVNGDIKQGFICKSKRKKELNLPNFLSFEDLINIHNKVENYSLKKVKNDFITIDMINSIHALKLVKQVKLNKKNNKIVALSNFVKATKIGEEYLCQNYFLFRPNQITKKIL